MRADRLLSIMLLLQVHRRMTARELATRLEVSERTIHRDMEALSGTGVPVMAERGAGGGWALPDGYKVNLNGLNQDEVQALFLTTPWRLLDDLGLQQASQAALNKLQAALPAGHQRDAEFVRQRILVDAAGWQRSGENVAHLPALQDAIWQERKVLLAYQRGDGTNSERVVDPLGLVAKGNVWYLVAAADGEPRMYRISRVQGVIPTDQPCERPAGFDLAGFWAASAANFVAGLPRYPVTVRANPAILPHMRYGGRFSRIERVDPPDESGCVKVAILFEIERDACDYALSYGPDLEVLEPESLRQQIRERALATAALYGHQA